MLRPIFYTFCNLTIRGQLDNELERERTEVSEDRIVDEWNREWIDKTFSFFSFLEQVRSRFETQVANILQLCFEFENTRKDTEILTNEYSNANMTHTRIYNIFYLIYILFEIHQIFLSVQRIINKHLVALLRLRIRREFS